MVSNEEALGVAKQLMRTCYMMYAKHATGSVDNHTHVCTSKRTHAAAGLAPEIVKFQRGRDFEAAPRARHSLLRPETVESLFLLWRVTHDSVYRDWGYVKRVQYNWHPPHKASERSHSWHSWAIFLSIEAAAKVPSGGYSSVKDAVDRATAATRIQGLNDHMESFFISETLKYLVRKCSTTHICPTLPPPSPNFVCPTLCAPPVSSVRGRRAAAIGCVGVQHGSSPLAHLQQVAQQWPYKR